jgi:uncharacterized protein YciI
MKLRSTLFVFVVVLIAALSVSAQSGNKSSASDFDANLAAKVGADEYGMKSFVFCILKTGPKDAEIKDKAERDKIFAGHMANIQRLADEGKLALAGPFGKNDRTYRGLFIFAVATVEEAQKLVETDPVIKSGMMTAELTPWYGSAATMLINENHKKVMKKNF